MFQSGFTLVELLVVLLIITAMTKIALEYTKDFAFQGRYEVTKDRYEKIKRAIIGRPDVLINGQPDISGFVADMGRLPRNLQELLVQNYCSDDYRISDNTPDATGITGATGATPEEWCTSETDTPGGVWLSASCNDPTKTTLATCGASDWSDWNGPYITSKKPDYKPNAISDGWGNEATGLTDHNYGWAFCLSDNPDIETPSTCYSPTNTGVGTSRLALQSKGKNSSINSIDSEYDADYPTDPILLNNGDWMVPLQNITINMQAPVQHLYNCSTNGVAENACKNTANWNWFGKPECRDGSNALTSHVTPSTCIAAGNTWYWFTGWPAGLSFCAGGTSIGNEIDSTTCSSVSGHWITDGLCSGGTGNETTLSECLSVSGIWRRGWCRGGSASGNEADSASCASVSGTWYTEWPLNGSKCSNPYYLNQTDCESAGHSWIVPFCTNPAQSTKALCTGANESWVISFCSVSGISTTDDSTFTEANCDTSGGVWGGCIGDTNSKNFCDSNGGRWIASTQDIDLVLVHEDGTDTVTVTATIEENGYNQNVVFYPATSFPQGLADINIYKSGTTNIYPPSCSGLDVDTIADAFPSDCESIGGTLLSNGLCDDVTIIDCRATNGHLLRQTSKALIVPNSNNLVINW
ncbi:prepilin-type N-terminal cleavage/methylation domain-containing protein [Methylomarinum vadi]|uniref:prepilin-type N-terminal cleavage/methylation domain-containing protein n=1 Tax=Methylomarinum vadi TaxID=438855 RepID=UPI000AE03DE4|nr:prepilin-type N-terminal cleavage/methylation domain-containing protein [Methylomarinum vadi]